MNQMMKTVFLGVAWMLGLTSAMSATLPPEQLLPADTLALVSIPDWDKASGFFEQSPLGQLWQDSALKPFQEKFLKQFNEDLIAPLEKQLGIKFADFSGLVHGQVTLALAPSDADDSADKTPRFIFLLDAKGQADRLKNQLAGLKKKWVEAGQQIKTEKIRNVEFTTLLIRRGDVGQALEKAFPPGDSQSATEKGAASKQEGQVEITLGQSDSLLIAGNSPKVLEKILIRQSGGSVAPLAEQPAYEANHSVLFRDVLAYAWVNFKPVYDVLLRELNESSKSGAPSNPMAPRPDKILSALGLGGLKTLAFKLSGSPEGSFIELFAGVPESSRQGIFKILVAEAKDASPPPFIPADAVKYSRWRLDGQKVWATLEAMVASISPEVANLLQMGLGTIGKDKDPNFDLKKSLIGNLGDDFIVYEKNPKASTLAELNSPPALFLIGSPNAEKLAQAVNVGASILTAATSDGAPPVREFLGRKIYSLQLPSPPEGGNSKPSKQMLSFAASGGYVALSVDPAILEEFLRSNEGAGRTLRETSGLDEAAQKVGGMSAGFFGYENQSETARVAIETLKNDLAKLEKLFSLPAIKDKLNAGKDAKEMKDWFDFSLLPPFDKLAKYFHFIVYGGGANADGLSWKIFAPTPPQMKK